MSIEDKPERRPWFDTLRLAQRLRAAGWPQHWADAITEAYQASLLVEPPSVAFDTLRLAKGFQMMGATSEQAAASARAVADTFVGR